LNCVRWCTLCAYIVFYAYGRTAHEIIDDIQIRFSVYDQTKMPAAVSVARLDSVNPGFANLLSAQQIIKPSSPPWLNARETVSTTETSHPVTDEQSADIASASSSAKHSARRVTKTASGRGAGAKKRQRASAKSSSKKRAKPKPSKKSKATKKGGKKSVKTKRR